MLLQLHMILWEEHAPRFPVASFNGGSDSEESACLQCETPGFDPWIRKIPWRSEWLPTLVYSIFPPSHSGILAWRIPWTEEPGETRSMGLQRVRHD